MKNIVIAGATGLIGKAIAGLLIDRGDKVTIFSRSVEKAKKVNILIKRSNLKIFSLFK